MIHFQWEIDWTTSIPNTASYCSNFLPKFLKSFEGTHSSQWSCRHSHRGPWIGRSWPPHSVWACEPHTGVHTPPPPVIGHTTSWCVCEDELKMRHRGTVWWYQRTTVQCGAVQVSVSLSLRSQTASSFHLLRLGKEEGGEKDFQHL